MRAGKSRDNGRCATGFIGFIGFIGWQFC